LNNPKGIAGLTFEELATRNEKRYAFRVLTYWFYPNPGSASYSNPKVTLLLISCAALLAASFAVSFWRRKVTNPMTRKLARSWPSALRWFGFIGLLLVVSRVEQIQYLSMRFLWLLWSIAALLFLFVQARLFHLRHYTVVKKEREEDPRDKYLPGKGR
jgi:hypothetical protein